jgi:cytochrome P450
VHSASQAHADEYPEAPILSPAYQANPYPYYRRWTSRAPFWATVGGRPAVIVARFHEVEAVYRDHRRFSSVKPAEPGMERFDFFNGFQDMVHVDPPDHTRLRACVSHAFMPRNIAKLEQRIETLSERLLDAVAQGDPSFEAMAQFARPLSVNTLLGVLLEVQPEDPRVRGTLCGYVAPQ